MIFVTVGTEKFPFDRLLQTLEEALRSGGIKEELFAQTGSCRFKPSVFPSKDFIRFDEMRDYIIKADIIVAHAGVGTALLCLTLGKIPILVPRRAKLGEHLDDHQLEFAAKMEVSRAAIVAYTCEELIQKILGYRDLAAKLNSSRSLRSENKKLTDYLTQLCSVKR